MRDAEMLSVVLREGATFAALGAAVSMMWQTNAESDFYILPLFFFFFFLAKENFFFRFLSVNEKQVLM